MFKSFIIRFIISTVVLTFTFPLTVLGGLIPIPIIDLIPFGFSIIIITAALFIIWQYFNLAVLFTLISVNVIQTAMTVVVSLTKVLFVAGAGPLAIILALYMIIYFFSLLIYCIFAGEWKSSF